MVRPSVRVCDAFVLVSVTDFRNLRLAVGGLLCPLLLMCPFVNRVI
jgi:hypothetical protein